MTTDVATSAADAKGASRKLAIAQASQRNSAIRAAAEKIAECRGRVLDANAKDLVAASQLLASGEISGATFERLRLTDKKILEMTRSMLEVAELPDPVGRVLERRELDSGLTLAKISVPLGVLAVIFEARPDAVTQICALAMKSANSVILKPGQEVERTATELVDIIHSAYATIGLPNGAATLIKGRDAVLKLLAMPDQIDMVIPRGPKQLVEFVQANTRIPVLGHAEGVCHIYVDASADLAMALEIIDDAKTDYPSACNAVETVLVHQQIDHKFLPMLAARLRSKNVRLRGCERSLAILKSESIEAVADADWHHEYCDLVLALRVVSSTDEAIQHINQWGSSHTETIVTEDPAAAESFLAQVDAAGVFHNASTRFADGYRYGFGAEVGISTSKLHARGPVGLEGLTTYKYVLRGSGQIARNYHEAGGKSFTHKRLPTE